jgi:hypothetical protein
MAKVYRAFRCDLCKSVYEDTMDHDRGMLLALDCNPTYPLTADRHARFEDVCGACRTKVEGALTALHIVFTGAPEPEPVPMPVPDSDFREVDEKEPL